MTKQERLEQTAAMLLSGALAGGGNFDLPTPWRLLPDGRWYRIVAVDGTGGQVEITADPPEVIVLP